MMIYSFPLTIPNQDSGGKWSKWHFVALKQRNWGKGAARREKHATLNANCLAWREGRRVSSWEDEINRRFFYVKVKRSLADDWQLKLLLGGISNPFEMWHSMSRCPTEFSQLLSLQISGCDSELKMHTLHPFGDGTQSPLVRTPVLRSALITRNAVTPSWGGISVYRFICIITNHITDSPPHCSHTKFNFIFMFSAAVARCFFGCKIFIWHQLKSQTRLNRSKKA